MSDEPSVERAQPTGIRGWALWRRPKPFIVFLLLMEALSIPGFALAFAGSGLPNRLEWFGFAILTAGATAHIQLTQRQEERRRSRTRTVLIDLTAVWVFPAVLIIPAELTVLLILIIRAQRWFTARRPAHNFIYSTVSHCLAASLAHLTFDSLGPHVWSSLTLLGSLREFAALIITALVYEAVQIVYVGGILSLAGPSRPTLSSILGSKADNLLEAITTGLGAVTAILLITMPPAVAIMAVVTVVFNRLAELDQLQNDARTDPKTAVYNMRGWSESAERAFGRATRSRGNLALLMIDLDHFKWINDSHGHPAGDDVLRRVAQAIDEATRPTDVVGRYGGEEFLVLLPDTDEITAAGAAERIRGTIAELRIVTTDKRGAQTTIAGRTTSIGVAVYPDHGDTLDILMQAADAAVYEAKENGRNQVRIAAEKLADTPDSP
ncbi:GGDEF domain-containing protein [Amycolatopsis nigrescens]|uniref:GGDEF domain-containing protein n=1 Tax=Amycolatopsis nigrescens TaxID=381445 RepID=UPI0003611CEB